MGPLDIEFHPTKAESVTFHLILENIHSNINPVFYYIFQSFMNCIGLIAANTSTKTLLPYKRGSTYGNLILFCQTYVAI